MNIQPRNPFERWLVERMKEDGEVHLAEELALELNDDGDYRLRITRLARDAWNEGFNAANRLFRGELYPK